MFKAISVIAWSKQRYFFEKGEGIVRGADLEIHSDELISNWNHAKTKILLGGSFVSKYQADTDPLLKLPENVGAIAGRAGLGV